MELNPNPSTPTPSRPLSGRMDVVTSDSSSDDFDAASSMMDPAFAEPELLVSDGARAFYGMPPSPSLDIQTRIAGSVGTVEEVTAEPPSQDRRLGRGLIRVLRPYHYNGKKRYEVKTVIDVREVGFIDARWLVSKKRTTNLGDVTNIWKKSVLNVFRESSEGSIDTVMDES